MSHVIGLDLSLTSTGVACVAIDEAERISAVVRLEKSAPAGDAPGPRWARLTNMAERIVTGPFGKAPLPDLVVVEGPSYGSSAQKSASIHDRAGLWWCVVGRLLDAGVPVAVCAPTVRAKWATGRGNAGKAEVSVGVARYWPDVNARADDEWDALALASMGAQRLGWLDAQAKHRDALGRIEWPMTRQVAS